MLAAVRGALKEVGLNTSASRKTTDNHALYEALERDVARLFRVERAVLVDNGYLTNLAVVQALRGEGRFLPTRCSKGPLFSSMTSDEISINASYSISSKLPQSNNQKSSVKTYEIYQALVIPALREMGNRCGNGFAAHPIDRLHFT